ncbi:Type I transmembrane sorting receptor [Dissophora ornata]|nr:Type I transmembrane sorting receptor [Dissophora ornata]
MKITAVLVSAAVTVLAIVEAAPATPQGFSVPLTLNPNHKRNFKAAIAKVNRRYPQLNLLEKRHHGHRHHSRKHHPRLHSHPDHIAAGTGVTPVIDVGPDNEYYGAVLVGTPGQTIHLNFDTGSADIWFPTSTCTTDACVAHSRFNTTKSSTYLKDDGTWHIAYGDGSSANGILGSDIVDVGGVKVRQTIGLATNESIEFAQAPEDGIFGLGFNSIETVKGVKTFMDNAIASKSVALPVVSVFLPSVRMNGGQGGHYLFGAIDHKRYSGTLTYVPVTKQGYWQVHVNDVKMNGQSLGQSSEAIIDTGTTLIIVSDAAAAAIHKNIQGAVLSDEEGGWLVPCALAKSKETFSFSMGGSDFKVAVADMAWDPLLTDKTTCFSGVQGGQDGLWLLGDMFVKNNYCVFDHSANPAVGIAPIKY